MTDEDIVIHTEEDPAPPPEERKETKWQEALLPPTPLLPLREIRKKAVQMRKEGMTGGRIDREVFIARYVDLWQECSLGMERARRGKRIRPDRQDPVTGKWVAQFKPDEPVLRAYIAQAQSLLGDLTKFRDKEEEVGIPVGMMQEIVDALKPFPEARKAVTKKLEKAK